MADPLRNELFQCDVCKTESAISFCENCRFKLGEVCHKKHTRLKSTRSHTLIDIGKIKISLLNVNCSACDEPATAFCEECIELLCDVCSSDHKIFPATKTHALSGALTSIEDNIPDSDNDEKLTITRENVSDANTITSSDSVPTDESHASSKPGYIPNFDNDFTVKHASGTDDPPPLRTEVRQVETQSNIEDEALLAKGTREDEPILTKGTRDDELLLAKGTSDDEPLLAEGTRDDEPLPAKGTRDDESLLAKGSRDDEPFQAKGTRDDEPLMAKGTRDDEPLMAKGTRDDEPLLAKGTRDDEPLLVKGTRDDEPLLVKGTRDDEPLLAKGTSDDEPFLAKGTRYDEPLLVEGTSLPQQREEVSDDNTVKDAPRTYDLSPSSTYVKPGETQCSINDKPLLDKVTALPQQREDISDNNTSTHMLGTDNPSPSSTDDVPAEKQANIDDEPVLAEGTSFPHQHEELSDDKNVVKVDTGTKEKYPVLDDIPGKPSANAIATDSIELIWRKPDVMTDTDTYQVRYKEVSKGKWKFCPEEFSINNVKISGLTTDTTYVFKVRLVNEDGESKYSEESEKIRTRVSFASTLLKSARRVKAESPLDIYHLPLMENRSARNNQHMTMKYDIGPKPGIATKERTLMLLGATGTGKSTLVDGLTNYLLGVNFEDTFRFTLMDDEDRKKQKDQAVSQTDWITCYSFNPQTGTKLEYRLNVIDTPGFGDTRGFQRDQKIVEQIRYLFSEKGEAGVQCIDAVCLLVKAPDARLTATQRYVFQSLMSIFGKDIAENICTLITFADGSEPPVLAAMMKSNLPFGNHFTFNNSALFTDNQRAPTNLAPMFWEMGIKSFFAFFDYLQTATTKSLQLTTKVLTERHRLELTIQNLQPQIDAGLSAIKNLQCRKEIFEKNQDMIKDNKNFEYEETAFKQDKIDLPRGKHVTNCLTCNMTCHENCAIADDDRKAGCAAMDTDGHCRQCVSTCHWTEHKNTKYIIKCREVKVKKTYKEMAKIYKDATGKAPDLKQVLEKIQKELEDLSDTIEMLMTEIRECNNRLKEIALRPNPLDVVEQIDLMIEAEKMEQRPGFQERIKVLYEFRKKATIADSFLKFKKEASVVHEKKKSRNAFLKLIGL